MPDNELPLLTAPVLEAPYAGYRRGNGDPAVALWESSSACIGQENSGSDPRRLGPDGGHGPIIRGARLWQIASHGEGDPRPASAGGSLPGPSGCGSAWWCDREFRAHCGPLVGRPDTGRGAPDRTGRRPVFLRGVGGSLPHLYRQLNRSPRWFQSERHGRGAFALGLTGLGGGSPCSRRAAHSTIFRVPQVRRAPARELRQDLAGSSAKRCPGSLRGA